MNFIALLKISVRFDPDYPNPPEPIKRQPHKMVKHTQAIRRLIADV